MITFMMTLDLIVNQYLNNFFISLTRISKAKLNKQKSISISMKLTIAILVITLLVSSLSTILVNVSTESEPNVMVSPECGELEGYSMILKVNGFEPNGNVQWQVVLPESKTIASYGYFATNSTGGFNEDVFIEGPLIKGSYEIQLFNDLDQDSLPDNNKMQKILTISVPC